MVKRKKKVDDISNKTLMVVLIVVIVISVSSLYLYLGALENSKPSFRSQAEGVVTLEIVERPPQGVSKSGDVSLQIVEPVQPSVDVVSSDLNAG
jgi:hypothetical protein